MGSTGLGEHGVGAADVGGGGHRCLLGVAPVSLRSKLRITPDCWLSLTPTGPVSKPGGFRRVGSGPLLPPSLPRPWSVPYSLPLRALCLSSPLWSASHRRQRGPVNSQTVSCFLSAQHEGLCSFETKIRHTNRWAGAPGPDARGGLDTRIETRQKQGCSQTHLVPHL